MADRVTNPEIIGPGFWAALHIMSKLATTVETARHLIYYIETVLAQNFPCVNPCREHIQKHIQRYPPRDVRLGVMFHKGNDVGFFAWAFQFHNIVNGRLGKKQLSFEEAYSFWYEGKSICQQNCTGSNPTSTEESRQPPLKTQYTTKSPGNGDAQEQKMTTLRQQFMSR